MIKSKQMLAIGVLAALGFAACGSDEAATDDGTAPTGTEATGETTAPDGTQAPDGTAGTTGEAPQVELSAVGLTFDIGGRGDQSFNDSAATGMTKAVDELGVTANELVPNADGSNRAELLQLQADAAQLVIGVGFLFADDTAAAAAENPETLFAVIDDAMLDFDNGGVPRCANCAGLTFAEEQGSFLVGAAAALKSETGTIGFIGGVSGFGLIEKFEAGFQAGALAVNPDIVIEAQYITAAPDFDGFFAPDRAKEIALTMYEGGADIVYHAAGGSGAGLFEAAKEQSEASGSKVWGIGVDSDQYNTVDPAVQEYVLTSMLKRVDTAVFEITKSVSEGAFQSGNVVYDLEAEGVGYSTSGGYVDDIIEDLEAFKAQIIDGTITVPTEPS
jgi:basic membrane protein A and related proteins